MENVTMMSMIPSNLVTLDMLNTMEAEVRLPAIIFQATMIVVGVLGNFFVWLIYGYRIKKQSAHRYLVLGKAVYDTLACCFGIPGNIVDLRNPYMFESTIGCKLLRFGYHVLAVGCSLSHFLNGIDRYRRICLPLKAQMSNEFVKRMLIFLFVLSLIIVSPTLAFYESVDVKTGVYGLTGRQCSHSERWSSSLYSLVFEIILSLMVMVDVTCLIVFYTLIGRRLCKRESIVSSMASSSIKQKDSHVAEGAKTSGINKVNDMENRTGFSKSESDKDKLHEAFPACHNNTINNLNTGIVNSRPNQDINDDLELATSSTNRSETMQNKVDAAKPEPVPTHANRHDNSDVLAIVRQMQIRKTSLRNAKSRKFTLITFLLAMIFVLSYFPVMVLALLSNLDPGKLDELSVPLKRTYYVFLVSYTINNVSNPLVYLAIDDEFRHQIKQCFVNIYRKCKRNNN